MPLSACGQNEAADFANASIGLAQGGRQRTIRPARRRSAWRRSVAGSAAGGRRRNIFEIACRTEKANRLKQKTRPLETVAGWEHWKKENTMIRKALLLSAARRPGAVRFGAWAQEKVVNVYNWSDYIDPAIIEEFTKETGIKVVYDVFDSNEILETKLLAGGSGYDVVVPRPTSWRARSRLACSRSSTSRSCPNISNMWDVVTERIAGYDPGNEYSDQLHVGHDRHRLQHQEGQGSARHRQDRQLGRVLRPGQAGEVRRLRRLRAGFADRHDPDRAELSRPRSRTASRRTISPRPKSC